MQNVSTELIISIEKHLVSCIPMLLDREKLVIINFKNTFLKYQHHSVA